MMKKILLASFVFYLVSCGSGNVVFVPHLNKRVKVFKNDTFQFYYPKKWETFDMGDRFNESPVISIAPAKKIYDVIRINKKMYGRDRRITISASRKESFSDDDLDDALQGKDASAKLLISLKKDEDIEEMVEKYTSLKKNDNRYRNFRSKKVSDDFYVINYRKEGRTRDVEYFFGVMINKIYLRQRGEDVYQIVYTAGQYEYNDHKKDAGLIFRSFKFLAD